MAYHLLRSGLLVESRKMKKETFSALPARVYSKRLSFSPVLLFLHCPEWRNTHHTTHQGSAYRLIAVLALRYLIHLLYFCARLCESLGSPLNASPNELIKFLQQVPAAILQSKVYMFEKFMRNPLPFKPFVDGGLVDDPILPREPAEMIANGDWNKVPVILGHNKDEGLLVKGFFQHVGGRQRRNWVELSLMSFFGREDVNEATLEELEEVCTIG